MGFSRRRMYRWTGTIDIEMSPSFSPIWSPSALSDSRSLPDGHHARVARGMKWMVSYHFFDAVLNVVCRFYCDDWKRAVELERQDTGTLLVCLPLVMGR